MDVGTQMAVAVLEGRAIDLAVVAADLRAHNIEPYNIDRQVRQLTFNAKQLRDGQPQTSLHQ